MKKIFALNVLVFTFFIAGQTVAQKVGLLMDSYVIDRWYLDQQLFHKKVEELGGQCIVKVPYGDPSEQVKLGKELVDSEIDVLVIVPTDVKKAAEVVEYAEKANIPVISYDRLVFSDALDFYISYDNYEVGKLQAQYLLKKVPKGDYLIINGPVTDHNAILFRDGQMEVLKPHIESGDIHVVKDIVLENWSELEALMTVDELYTYKAENIDAVLAANDALARGTLQALPVEMVDQIAVTGQDAELEAIKYIIKGDQSMTIYKPIQQLAYKAAEVAMMMAKGEDIAEAKKFTSGDISVDAILLKPIVVDKSNYKATVVEDGHVSLSELFENK